MDSDLEIENEVLIVEAGGLLLVATVRMQFFLFTVSWFFSNF